MKERALKFFRGEEKYNCAQAILKGAQKKFPIPQEKVDVFKAFGGGRAEGGLCGALFAAKFLVENPQHFQEIEKQFAEITGGVRCKDIRKLNKVPCRECVGAAAELLEKTIGQNN